MPGRVEEVNRNVAEVLNSRNSSEDGPAPNLEVDGLYRNKNMAQIVSLLVGTDVRVRTKDGRCHEGTLEAVSPKFELAARLVYEVGPKDGERCIPRDQVYDKLTFEPDSITEIETFTELDAGPGKFKIDSFIGERQSGVRRNGEMQERNLEVWEPELEEDSIGDLEASGESRLNQNSTGWDAEEMFKRNQELGMELGLNTNSSYREDMAQYSTVHLPEDDNSEEYNAKRIEAEKLAREIMNNPASKHAAALENEDSERSLDGRESTGAPTTGSWRNAGPGPAGAGMPQNQGYGNNRNNGPRYRNERGGGRMTGVGRGGPRGGGMGYNNRGGPPGNYGGNRNDNNSSRFSPHERSPAVQGQQGQGRYGARSPPYHQHQQHQNQQSPHQPPPQNQQQQQHSPNSRDTGEGWEQVRNKKDKKPSYSSDMPPGNRGGPRDGGGRMEGLREFHKSFQLAEQGKASPQQQHQTPPQQTQQQGGERVNMPTPQQQQSNQQQQKRPQPSHQHESAHESYGQHRKPSESGEPGNESIASGRDRVGSESKDESHDGNYRHHQHHPPLQIQAATPISAPTKTEVENAEKTPNPESFKPAPDGQEDSESGGSKKSGFSLNPDAPVFTPRSGGGVTTPMTPSTPILPVQPPQMVPYPVQQQQVYNPSPSPQVQVMPGGPSPGMYHVATPAGMNVATGPPGTSFTVPPPPAGNPMANNRNQPRKNGPALQTMQPMQQYIISGHPQQMFATSQQQTQQQGVLLTGLAPQQAGTNFTASPRFLGPSPGPHYMVPQMTPSEASSAIAQPQVSFTGNHPPPASSANSGASHSNNASQPPTPGPQPSNPSPAAPALSATPQSPHYHPQMSGPPGGYIQAAGPPMVQTVMVVPAQAGQPGPFYIPHSGPGGYFQASQHQPGTQLAQLGGGGVVQSVDSQQGQPQGPASFQPVVSYCESPSDPSSTILMMPSPMPGLFGTSTPAVMTPNIYQQPFRPYMAAPQPQHSIHPS